VENLTDSTIHVAVRSRKDIKKPTCTFDANALMIADQRYQSVHDGHVILYTFKGKQLVISAEKKESEGYLNYYCSGGASLADTYTKIDEALDEKQVDPTIFHKTLNLLQMGYVVSSAMKNGATQLIVEPYGLKGSNESIKQQLEGAIQNAEIEDLDRDGYPEVLIYVAPAKGEKVSQVVGFSPNQGKSLSFISFPSIADNPKINKGYDGHEEFAIVENTLVQRFKLYDNTGGTRKETGKMRQIQYKLRPGEASKQFVIDKVIEF
jgi:hypothetical protein